MATNEVGIKITGDANPYKSTLASVVAETKKSQTQLAGMATASSNVFRRTGEMIRSHFRGVATTVGGFFSGITHTINRSFQLIGAHALGLRTALAGLFAGFGLVRFVQSLIRAGSELETFNVQLTAVFRGSQRLANEALRTVIEFARTTPFTTREAIQTFTMLQSVGIKASEEILEAVGNAAFVFNRQMTDVANAMISMETQTLRRLGVVLDRTGEKARIMAGGVTKEVLNTREAIFAGMIEVFQEVFPGAMKKAEDTWRGSMANLKSLFEEFAFRAGGRITKSLVPQIQSFVGLFDSLQKSGVIKAIEDDLVSMVSGFMTWMNQAIARGVEFVALHREDIKREVLSVWEGAKNVWGEAAKAFSILFGIVKEAYNLYTSLPDTVKAVGLIGAIFFGPVRAVAAMGALGLLLGKQVETAKTDAVKAAEEIGKALGGGTAQGALPNPAARKAEETGGALNWLMGIWNSLPKEMKEWMGIGAGVGATAGAFGGPLMMGKGALLGGTLGMAYGGTNALMDYVERRGGFMTGGPKLAVPPEIDKIIEEKAAKYAIDPNLVRAIIQKESHFNITARGAAGELGLMQLMPANIKAFGVKDPFDPAQNIEAGIQLLREEINRFPESMIKAIAAYNAGSPAVTRGQIPQVTMQKYVPDVLKFRDQFTAQYGGAQAAGATGPAGSGGWSLAMGGPGFVKPPFIDSIKQVNGLLEDQRQIVNDLEEDWLLIGEELQQMAREQMEKYGLQVSAANSVITEQTRGIDDMIAGLNMEIQLAGKMGTELTEQKTILEGQLAVQKLIRDQKQKNVEFGEQEKRVMEELAGKYRELAAFRVQTERTSTVTDLLRSQRESLENLRLEVEAAGAVTREQRVQIELRRLELEQKRKGVELTQEEAAELKNIVTQRTETGDIFQRHQEFMQVFEEGFKSAIQNIQSTFADMWFNVFSGGTRSWKDFLRDFLQSFLRVIANMQSALLTAFVGQMFPQAGGGGGIFGSIIGSIGGMIGSLFSPSVPIPGLAGTGVSGKIGSYDTGGMVKSARRLFDPKAYMPPMLSFASGGMVPIGAHEGEYVLNQRATSDIGVSDLDRWNFGGVMPDNRSMAGGFHPGMIQMPEPKFGIHVEFLGDVVNPAAQGLTPEETVKVWIEDFNKGGETREAIKSKLN